MRVNLFSILFPLVLLLVPYRHAKAFPDGCVETTQLAMQSGLDCRWCTQLFFANSLEIAVNCRDGSLRYRDDENQPFTKSPLKLKRPHSIIYSPSDKLYYLTDTDNNRIISVSSLAEQSPIREITELAGIRLHRPHDIALDPSTGYLYTINPAEPVVFRYDPVTNHQEALDLSPVLDYSRALSFIKGKLFITGSSSGAIVEVNTFSTGNYTVHHSFDKKLLRTMGTWRKTGLIPNDIEWFRGHWYISSYFTSAAAREGDDYNRNKLIRFRNWDELRTGKWQDLSHLVPDGLLPYYFSKKNDTLYIAIFNHVKPGDGDTFIALTDSCSPPLPHLVPLLL